MRSKIELLELLKEKVGSYTFKGMCLVVSNMFFQGVVNIDELKVLRSLLSEFDPKERYSHTHYWFSPRLKQPRIDWIDSVIKKLQDANE